MSLITQAQLQQFLPEAGPALWLLPNPKSKIGSLFAKRFRSADKDAIGQEPA